MIDDVSFLWLYVSDLERSIQFYSKTLGFEVSRRWKEGATFDLKNLTLGLHVEEGKIVHGNSPVITFRVSGNIDDVYADLKARGVHFDQPITTEVYGKVAGFQDPDGHALLLHQPHDELSD